MAKSYRWKKQLKKTLGQVRCASFLTARLTSQQKKKILQDVSRQLICSEKKIIRENQRDLRTAKQEGLSSAMLDRLTLTPKRIREMAEGVRAVASLPDPIGRVVKRWKRPNGLVISRVTVPIGVILIIFESRPNVTAECASLCLKSGNAVILRGGREAFYSNRVLVSIFDEVLRRYRLTGSCIGFVQTTDRQAVDFLLHQDKEIQLVIPRGGEQLIRKVAETSRIPVVKHYQGICHVYVDQKADSKKAVNIAFNAKMQRPGVCNAMETLLVHRKIASRFLPELGRKLREGGCEVRGDAAVKKILPWAQKATPEDYGCEFLDKVLAVRVVSDIDEAMAHIQKYGSGHTDAIVTQDSKAAKIFRDRVDSSSVMVNASTRFSDGFQYGFGAEIGISTDKIHARGPMGLEGLTSYKYVVEGNGQVRT
ncbi:MAG: glutamate-5-semialdehyde dehydrogenase [Candidatus Omnitrophica bacterium]|nr:glutamate-5-semialdehyde dehydrogenase [Candidatus Omnitrophota bacterium]